MAGSGRVLRLVLFEAEGVHFYHFEFSHWDKVTLEATSIFDFATLVAINLAGLRVGRIRLLENYYPEIFHVVFLDCRAGYEVG